MRLLDFQNVNKQLIPLTKCQKIQRSSKWKWFYASARLTNFTHLWFHFRRCVQERVFMWSILHVRHFKGLKDTSLEAITEKNEHLNKSAINHVVNWN